MAVEYLGIQEIRGPLMVLEHIKGVAFDELVGITLDNGEKRTGRVVDISDDACVVP